MSSQKEITQTKGIGQKTLDKLAESGYDTPEALKTLTYEKLIEMGIQAKQINVLLETLDIPKHGSNVKELANESEEKQFLTRAYQHKYDLYEMVSIYKYNMWKCEECGHDTEPRGQMLWQDPESGELFLRMRTVCRTSCEIRDRLFALHSIKPEDETDKHPWKFE